MTYRRIAVEIRRWGRLPFVSPLFAPMWLGLRIYLGLVWIRFGWSKVEAGWIGGDGLSGLMAAIANGSIHTPFGLFAPVAQWMVGAGITPMLSSLIPVAEVTFGVLFLAGVLLVPAAVGATVLNLNLLLAGVAVWSFDGRIIGLQILMALGWRSATELGLRDSIARVAASYQTALRRLRHA